MTRRHTLSLNLDKRLVSYAAESFNAYEAVYGIQQITGLLPVFAHDLESMFGKAGIGDARRAWGVVADLISAIAHVSPTMESLIDFGFVQAVEVDHIIPHGGDFTLATSPVLRRLDFRAAILGDLSPIILTAVEHDTLAKPLLDAFQDELRAYDADASSNMHEESELRTFRDLVHVLPDVPEQFPTWDGRPMFLDEQKALLDYLSKRAGCEIVADALVDEPLGEFLLRSSGVITRSDFSGDPVLNLNLVPHELLKKPAALVCHQVGHAALTALKNIGPNADILDCLYAIEIAVEKEMHISVTPALASTRALIVENALRGYVAKVTDIRGVMKNMSSSVLPFDFPDLANE